MSQNLSKSWLETNRLSLAVTTVIKRRQNFVFYVERHIAQNVVPDMIVAKTCHFRLLIHREWANAVIQVNLISMIFPRSDLHDITRPDMSPLMSVPPVSSQRSLRTVSRSGESSIRFSTARPAPVAATASTAIPIPSMSRSL